MIKLPSSSMLLNNILLGHRGRGRRGRQQEGCEAAVAWEGLASLGGEEGVGGGARGGEAVGYELGEEDGGGRRGIGVGDQGDHGGDVKAGVAIEREGVAGEKELELR